MSFEVVTCPRCKGTNIVPDIGADGSFGTMWCAGCKLEFSAYGWRDRLRNVWRGFILGLAAPLIWLKRKS
jgi:hypothetical protein